MASEMKFRKDFNGYSGFGNTEREAEIALAYACAYLLLAHNRQEDSDGDAYFGNLPGWDGKEEENYAALTNRYCQGYKEGAATKTGDDR